MGYLAEIVNKKDIWLVSFEPGSNQRHQDERYPLQSCALPTELSKDTIHVSLPWYIMYSISGSERLGWNCTVLNLVLSHAPNHARRPSQPPRPRRFTMENDQVRPAALYAHCPPAYLTCGVALSNRVFSSTFTSRASARRPVRAPPACSPVPVPHPSGIADETLPPLLPAPPPRHLTDRLITSKDHASVQISVADVDANGRALATSTSFALCGQVRADGESDDSINRLATKAGRESHLFRLFAGRGSSADRCSSAQFSAMSGHTKSSGLV